MYRKGERMSFSRGALLAAGASATISAAVLLGSGTAHSSERALAGYRLVDGVAVSESVDATSAGELDAYLQSDSPMTVTVDIETGDPVKVVANEDLEGETGDAIDDASRFPGLFR